MIIEKVIWNAMIAVSMEAGGYQALLVPEMGANMVKLYNKEKNVNILHTPNVDEMQTFKERPQIFGLPLLFPPNRIEDGTYTYNGRKYQYPITIPGQNNYHHGIIKSQPFTITRTFIGPDYVEVEATYFSNEINDAIYVNFPHQFECRMKFKLSAAGLEHTVTFVNLSKEEMPLGVGYHTPINVPFIEGTKGSDYRLQLSAGKRWELSEDRTLPTGKLFDLTAEEALLRGEGIVPVGEPVEAALSNVSLIIDGKPYNGAIMTETKSGTKVFYEVDNQVKYWTLWNNGGGESWACPEPQTWATNAPNLKLDPSITGFQTLPAGKSWSTVSKIYVK